MANISLADLTKEAEKNGSVIIPQKHTQNPSNVVPVSVTQMASAVNPPKNEEVKNPPVVDIGFSSLAATVQDIKKGSEVIAERNRLKAEEEAYDDFEKELTGDTIEETSQPADDLGLDEYDTSVNTTYTNVENENKSESTTIESEPTVIDNNTPNVNTEEPVNEEKVENKKEELETEENEPVEIKIDDFDDLLSELEDDGYSDTSTDENDFNDEEEDADEVRERMANTVDREIRDKLFVNKFDPTKLRISKKPTSVSMALNYHTSTKATADFPLYHTKHCSKFKECTGTELQTLETKINAGNEITSIIEAVKFNYDHIVDPNKPDKFEKWAKMIRTEDVEAMYFGIYKATYFSSNLVPVTCDHCKTSNLVKVPVNDMVKPLNDEVKREMDKLFQQDTSFPYPEVKSELVQVSDRLFAAVKPPSVYDAFVQFASISPENQRKYQLILNLISCIESFYFLNNEGELSPITINTDPTNIKKTVTRKVRDYGSLMKALTADQYATFISKINNLMEEPKISFIIPEVECPNCHKMIPQRPVSSMLQVLFTRAQLAQIKNS